MSTRRFSRVGFQVDATVRTADRTFQGEVENLSMNGMFMLTGEQVPLGTPVDICIVLTGTTPEISVTTSGAVSRIVDNGLGFTFEKTGPESYVHLKNIVAYNTDDADKIMEEIHHSIGEKLAATNVSK
jgi:hypothetical protein